MFAGLVYNRRGDEIPHVMVITIGVIRFSSSEYRDKLICNDLESYMMDECNSFSISESVLSVDTVKF